MFGSFEIKTYASLNFALGLVNAALLGAVAVVAYYFILTPAHTAAAHKAIDLIYGKVSIPVLAGLWGVTATLLLRLHDRWHEPHIRKWRAIYDADFILRSLLCDCGTAISEDLYEKAYSDGRVRNKLMQRLFYNFVGDEAQTGQGRRLFIYTVLWRYWTLALVDLYAIGFLIGLLVYHISTKTPPNVILVLVAVGASLFSRVLSNQALDEAHSKTLEQVAEIKAKHADELKKQAIALDTDLGI